MLLFFCLSVLYFQLSKGFQVYVSSTNYLTSATSNNVFRFQGSGQTILANSYIQIQYDPMWTLTSATGYDNTKDYCQTGCTMSSVIFTKTLNKIKIDGLFPNAINSKSYVAQFTIKSVINPNKQTIQILTANVYQSDGSFYTSADASIRIYPSQMVCTGVPTNKIISTFTQYSFSITPSISFPSDGYMMATFPSQWSDSSETTVLQTPTCTNSLGVTVSCPSTTTTVKVTSVVSVSGSSPFSFKILGIRNPGSTGINEQLWLTYYNSANQAMSKCSVEISGLTPKSLSSVTFSLSCQNAEQAIGFLQFTIQQKPRVADKMVVTIPGQIQTTYLTKGFIYAGTDTTQLNKDIEIESRSASQSKISFFPFKIQALNYFRVQFYNLRCPSTIKQTNNFTIQIIRMGSIITTYQCCNITTTLSPIQSVAFSLEDNRMAQVTNYRFVITLSQTIANGTGFVDFIFPSAYALSIGNTYSCYIQGFSQPSNTVCTVISSTLLGLKLATGNLSLLLETIKSSSVSGSVSLGIVISAVKNPSVSAISFDIYISDVLHNRLQGITAITSSLTAALISGVQITATSYQVYALTTYTIKINNTNTLIANSILRVKFPTQLKLQSPVVKINSVAAVFTQTTVSSRFQLDITLPNSAIAQYGLLAYTITVDNVRNSESFENTDTFIFQLQSAAVILEGIYDGLSVSMNQVNAFSTTGITVVDNHVYQLSQYDVSYSFPMTYNALKSYKLKILFPSQFRIYTCSVCTGLGQFSINSNNGLVKFEQVKNPYKTQISSTVTFQLYIDNYLSLQSTYSLQTFTSIVQDFGASFSNNIMGKAATYWVTVKLIKEDMKEIRIQLPSQTTINTLNVTCLACEVTSFSESSKLIKVIVSKIQAQNVTFEITGVTNPIAYPSSIFTLSSYSSDSVLISQSTTMAYFFTIVCNANCATCNPLVITQCYSCYQNALINSLKYFNNLTKACAAACSPTQYMVGLNCYSCDSSCNGCINQSHICTSCSGVNSLFNNQCLANCPLNYYAQSNLCKTCTPPCLTCSSNLICTYCIYGKLLRTDGSCQDTCLTGYYNKSNICTICPPNCDVCDSSSCSSCKPSAFLLNGNCLSQCPFGYFIDSTNLLCQPCQPPCKYCSGTSSNCIGCDLTSAQPYFYLNQCIGGCLATFYSDSLYQCQSCVSPCADCNSQTNCTSCQVGYLFYAPTNQCFVACITNTLQIGSQCLSCQSQCLQCTGTVNYCTSCIQNYFLDQTAHTCGLTCVAPYVALNRLCLQCVSPCVTCLTNQPYKCLTCIATYKLLQNNCYQACPSGTYDSSGQCLACTSGCYQCSTSSATCTSCFPGTYLFGTSCIPTCPAAPVYYYQYQSQCISCQAPCKSCLATPIQCSQCLSLTDYWNPVTLQCTSSCSAPFYSIVLQGKKQCKSCQFPCKTCSTGFNKCSSCFNGKYLISEQCSDSCPVKFYAQGNTCQACPNLCQTCTQFKCLTCDAGCFLYKQYCYSSCPLEAPYPYGTFCRNCLKENCYLCNQINQCVMCFQKYLLFNGTCFESCPSNYQPDKLTKLSCVKKSQQALFQFIESKQRQKIFILPATIIMLFLFAMVIFLPGNNLIGLFSLISIPEIISTIFFVYFYVIYSQEDLKISFTFPNALFILISALNILVSIFYVLRSNKIFMMDQSYKVWYQYGSNQKRTNLILIIGILNFKLTKLLFSGFFKLPFTSYQLKDKDLIKFLNYVIFFSIITYNVPLIFFSFYVIVAQKSFLINNKILFSAVDCLIVEVTSLIICIVYLLKSHQLPQIYKKFIIQGISVLSLPPHSEPNQYIGNEGQNDLHLFHSNSVEDISQRKELKEVDFKSVYDPSEYEDPPKVDQKQLQNALKKGKFRTKERPKKKGKGKYRLDNLQMIQEQISDEEQNMNAKNKKVKQKKESFVNNYIYWQAPKSKKSRAQQVFKQNRRQIMQKIYEKQSQFDTITNNDIIFLQDSDQDGDKDSIIDNFDDQNGKQDSFNQSKRQLKPSPQKNRYNNLFNLNYAKRKHLN